VKKNTLASASFAEQAIQLGKQAKAAARHLAVLSSDDKNRALQLMADRLEDQSAFLIEENQNDVDSAKKAGIAGAVLDRIALTRSRVRAMAKGLREIAILPDPVREILKISRRPNGQRGYPKRWKRGASLEPGNRESTASRLLRNGGAAACHPGRGIYRSRIGSRVAAIGVVHRSDHSAGWRRTDPRGCREL
jgi:glutamate-5-semialdehyde dehydrogenase